MNKSITHPIWTHLPAIGALAVFLFYLANAGPLPAQVPVHFSLAGTPNGYGSPWMAFGLFIGLSVFYILLSAFFDEMWARQETAKSFNWLSLMDELIVGAIVGSGLAYLAFVKEGGQTFLFPWTQAALAAGASIAAATLLELARPFHPHPGQASAESTEALDTELSRHLSSGANLVYWDAQNPWYVKLLATGLPVAMFAGAALQMFTEPAAAIPLVIAGAIFIMFIGGQRTTVTRKEVNVRYGILGFKVFRASASDITGVEVHSFSPLKDFGGYGIRFNREMRAYYLNGTRGVKLTTSTGKKYLIGSDRAERLASVIRAVAGKK